MMSEKLFLEISILSTRTGIEVTKGLGKFVEVGYTVQTNWEPIK